MMRYTHTACVALSILQIAYVDAQATIFTAKPSVPAPRCDDPPEAGRPVSMFNAAAIPVAIGGATGIFYDPQKYYGTIQVGDPPQDMTVAIDTGSSDIWCPTQKLLDDKNIHAVPVDPTSLSKYGNGSVPLNLDYGVPGSNLGFSGTLYKGTYNMGGTKADAVMGLMHTSDRKLVAPQGIFGLAGAGAAATAVETKDIRNPAIYGLGWDSFGIHVSRDPGMNARGSLASDGVENLFEGNFTYEPVAFLRARDASRLPESILKNVGAGEAPPDTPVFAHWEFNITDVTLGDTKLQLNTSSVIIDCGTPTLTLENSLLAPILEGFNIDINFYTQVSTKLAASKDPKISVEDAKKFSFPCEKAYPDTKTTSATGVVYTVTSAEEVHHRYMIPTNVLLNQPELLPLGCTPAISPSGGPQNILGVPFQKAYYTYHIIKAPEGGEPWLGFAKSV